MHGPNEEHEVALTPTTTTARWIASLSPAVAPDLSALLQALHDREFDAARVIGERLSATLLGEDTHV